MRRPVEDWRARRALRRCTCVACGVRAYGVPSIDNQGRIEIGRDVAIASIPLRAHLATGPSGLLRIGDRVRVAHGSTITAYSEVIIGDDVTIGPLVMVLDIDFHEISDRASRGDARPIRIGRGVRIGSGAVILRGVVIGEEAEIAPNSVVSRFVPTGAHVRGVPAQPVRSA